MNEQAPQATVDAVAGSRAKVFVSYSRKDLLFAQSLVEALTERGFDAFLDKTDIAPGEPWKERLGGLIAAADTVVFAISPDSVASTVCAWELDESARLGKRLIPVVARRIPDADAPPALGRLNWVFCTESDDKDAALTALDTANWRGTGTSRSAAEARPCAAPTSTPPSAGSIGVRPTPMHRPICIRISSARAGVLPP
jgi:hypothetical protein